MDELYELAEQEGIVIERWRLTPPLNALYVKEPALPPLITIADRIREGSALYRTLLAHEMGHHFTTSGDITACRHCVYGEMISANRAEHRANLWAAEFFMPWDDLESAFHAGIKERWALAEHFGVTEDLVEFRLRNLWCMG